MKQGQQKAKGHAYERRVAKILTDVYYPDGSGVMKKTPLSGGWRFPGDIIPLKFTGKGEEVKIDQSWPFMEECKDYKDVKHFFSGLYSKDSQVFEWMDTAERDSVLKGGNKIPLVIFKLYRQKDVVILDGYSFHRLEDMFGVPNCCFFFLRKIKQGLLVRKLVFLLLTDFIDWIDFEVFKASGNVNYIKSLIKRSGD